MRQVYNDFGYLKEIRLWTDADSGKVNSQLQGKVYWMADSFDVSGRIDGESYGNGTANDRWYSDATGRLRSANIDQAKVIDAPYQIQQLTYTYDQVGNVTSRIESAPGFARSDTFYATTAGDGYDGLDRLKVHKLNGTTVATVSYDQKGNITNKSDVGAYTYWPTRTHAVKTAGLHTDYSYDANGNMTYGAGRNLIWTSFNQLKTVSDTNTGKSSEFSFGASHERVKQVRKQGATTLDTTVYVGSLFEKVTTAATGLVEHKHYLIAPTGRIAVYTERSDLTKDTRYFHTDGLGSITVVTDEAARVLTRYAYDAWGKQSVIYSNPTPGFNNLTPTTRGFTDHEMLADVGLVHMNGRVYDPLLGRFLSADPFVDDATNAQAYNRYSYVSNNPLNHTDPSGFFKLKDALKIVAAVAVGVVTAGAAMVAYGAAIGGSFTGGFLGAISSVGAAAGWSGTWAAVAGAGFGFGSGFAGSLLNGGSLGDAFKAGVIGGAIGGVSAYVASGIRQGFEDWSSGTQKYYNVRPDPLNPGKMLPPEEILDTTTITGGQRIFENGMLNSLDDAAKNGGLFYRGQSYVLAHNPTHGFVADLTESTLGKLTGSSALGRDLAGVLGQIDAGHSTLFMHSQGAQIGFNALGEAGRRGISLSGLSLKVYGGATNMLTSNMIAHSVGANITSWTMNAFDAVPNIAGLNALYAPQRFITSTLGAPFLFAGSALSPHSSLTGTGKTFWSIFNTTY